MTKPKILLSGASGTGKTTLAEFLSAEYGIPKMAFSGPNGECWSAARHTAWQITGEPNPYNVPDRRAFQLQLLANMGRWIEAQGDGGYVCDRGDADQWAYSCLHGPDDLRDNPEIFYKAIARPGQSVALCSIDRFFDLGSDPVRKSAKAYHLATEGLIVQYMDYYRGGWLGDELIELCDIIDPDRFALWFERRNT